MISTGFFILGNALTSIKEKNTVALVLGTLFGTLFYVIAHICKFIESIVINDNEDDDKIKFKKENENIVKFRRK